MGRPMRCHSVDTPGTNIDTSVEGANFHNNTNECLERPYSKMVPHLWVHASELDICPQIRPIQSLRNPCPNSSKVLITSL